MNEAQHGRMLAELRTQTVELRQQSEILTRIADHFASEPVPSAGDDLGEDVRDWLRTRSRGQIGINFMVALQLLEYALHLRMFGENASGGSETWAQFDRDAEMFLRMIKGGDE